VYPKYVSIRRGWTAESFAIERVEHSVRNEAVSCRTGTETRRRQTTDAVDLALLVVVESASSFCGRSHSSRCLSHLPTPVVSETRVNPYFLSCRRVCQGACVGFSDVLALAWPESQGFGPAWSGFGPEICQAKPTSHGFGLAWPGFGPGLGSSTKKNTIQMLFVTSAKVILL
jgi:hypothetical protein